MPLAALPSVPYVLAGEVPGLDGTRVLPVVADPRDRCVLWVIERQMAGAQLDLAGVDALLATLAEVAAVMRAAIGTPPGAEPPRS